MKQLLIKIPAMIALLISLVSFVWYVLFLLDLVHDETWLLSVLTAMFSIPFFFVDAIISFVRAVKKIDSKFNFILAVVLIGAIPMIVIFGGDGKDFFNVIWNVYYLVMFVLEVISIKRAYGIIKAN